MKPINESKTRGDLTHQASSVCRRHHRRLDLEPLLSHRPATPPTPTSNRTEKTVGVGSIYYLMRRDVRQGAAQLRRNAKTIKSWIEEAEAGAKKNGGGAGEAGKPLPGADAAPPKQVPPSPSSSSSAPSKAE